MESVMVNNINYYLQYAAWTVHESWLATWTNVSSKLHGEWVERRQAAAWIVNNEDKFGSICMEWTKSRQVWQYLHGEWIRKRQVWQYLHGAWVGWKGLAVSAWRVDRRETTLALAAWRVGREEMLSSCCMESGQKGEVWQWWPHELWSVIDAVDKCLCWEGWVCFYLYSQCRLQLQPSAGIVHLLTLPTASIHPFILTHTHHSTLTKLLNAAF